MLTWGHVLCLSRQLGRCCLLTWVPSRLVSVLSAGTVLFVDLGTVTYCVCPVLGSQQPVCRVCGISRHYSRRQNHVWIRISFPLPSSIANRLAGLVVKASASGAEDPGFESRVRRDFPGLSHTSDLKNWHSSGCPPRRMPLWSQRWDWSARGQYTVTV